MFFFSWSSSLFLSSCWPFWIFVWSIRQVIGDWFVENCKILIDTANSWRLDCYSYARHPQISKKKQEVSVINNSLLFCLLTSGNEAVLGYLFTIACTYYWAMAIIVKTVQCPSLILPRFALLTQYQEIYSYDTKLACLFDKYFERLRLSFNVMPFFTSILVLWKIIPQHHCQLRLLIPDGCPIATLSLTNISSVDYSLPNHLGVPNPVPILSSCNILLHKYLVCWNIIHHFHRTPRPACHPIQLHSLPPPSKLLPPIFPLQHSHPGVSFVKQIDVKSKTH